MREVLPGKSYICLKAHSIKLFNNVCRPALPPTAHSCLFQKVAMFHFCALVKGPGGLAEEGSKV